MNQVQEIPIDKLEPHPANVRTAFDAAALASLAESIGASGILQPLVVCRVDDHYRVIAGHRRLGAAKLAGLTAVPCTIREIAEDEQVAEMLAENVQRENLSPIEEARGFESMAATGLNQAAIARRLGISAERVSSRMLLLQLSPEVQVLVHGGALSVGCGQELARIPHPEVQKRTAIIAARAHWSVAQLKNIVNREVQRLTPALQKAPVARPAWKEKTAPTGTKRRAQVMAWLETARGSVSFAMIRHAAKRSCGVCGMADAESVCADCPMLELLDQIQPAARANEPTPLAELRRVP